VPSPPSRAATARRCLAGGCSSAGAAFVYCSVFAFVAVMFLSAAVFSIVLLMELVAEGVM
jgi:hypothetical protein